MSKLFTAALLGAASILMLAGLGMGETPTAARQSAVALPQIAADAPSANTPRECSTAQGITASCNYQ
jgi:hypothetical protein